MERGPNRYQLLNPHGYLRLADALGDTPESAVAVHRLREGLCRVYLAGDPAHSDGAIVQDLLCPEELLAFGRSPEVLVELLRMIRGWDCVLVDGACAPFLGALLEEQDGESIRYLDNVYHIMTHAAPLKSDDYVRLFNILDHHLLQTSHPDVQGRGFGSSIRLLTTGVVAGAIVLGKVVSLAYTYARTPRFADIGVHTLDAWRGRGFAAATSALVARRIQDEGQLPVWTTTANNAPAMELARKLGFTEYTRRIYVIRGKE